jgi:hypothetical protein
VLPSDSARVIAPMRSSVLVFCYIAASASGSQEQVVPQWHGRTPADLHSEYRNIFKHGNRNAASHLWSSFLLDRAATMTTERLIGLFHGFCAVSGSPVTPHDYSRYRLTLQNVAGTKGTGYMLYCCWPCVCDTQVRTQPFRPSRQLGKRTPSAGFHPHRHEERDDFRRHAAVSFRGHRQPVRSPRGAACAPAPTSHGVLPSPHSAAPRKPRNGMQVPFQQSFGWGETTLHASAPEVRCASDGKLLGAYMSDHGYPIITMFFDDEFFPEVSDEASHSLTVPFDYPTPGRIHVSTTGTKYQDEREYGPECTARMRAGYNSGMGEIFRKVAGVSPISIPTPGHGEPRLPGVPLSDSAARRSAEL